MSNELLLCPCGKPVQRRAGPGRPPRTCLACRQPYRDRKKVEGGSPHVILNVLLNEPDSRPRARFKAPKRGGGFTLADLNAQPVPEEVHFVMPERPRKAVVAEQARI